MIEAEISKALAAAGCGVVRGIRSEPPKGPQRDWLIVASKGLGEGPSLKEILCTVASVTRVGTEDLKSARRYGNIARARMIYYVAARKLTSHSFPVIGRSLGDRHHSTIINGLRRIMDNPKTYEPELSQVLSAVMRGRGQ